MAIHGTIGKNGWQKKIGWHCQENCRHSQKTRLKNKKNLIRLINSIFSGTSVYKGRIKNIFYPPATMRVKNPPRAGACDLTPL
jgi:hypothetical protein